MTDHIEKIEIKGVYRFTNPSIYIPAKVVVKFYDGEIVVCRDCANLNQSVILTLDLFMDLEPMIVDRL